MEMPSSFSRFSTHYERFYALLTAPIVGFVVFAHLVAWSFHFLVYSDLEQHRVFIFYIIVVIFVPLEL